MGRRGHHRPPLRGLNGSNGANTSAARYSSPPLARPQPDNRGVVESWDSFGVVVGAASGALLGLLFVAISVNASCIAKHPALHVVASRTLVLFAIPLVAAILVVTPRQADWALDAELIVLGVVAGAALIFVGRGHVDVDASAESRFARTLNRTSPTLATSLLTEIARVTLIVGGGGLYWLVPALILAPGRRDAERVASPRGSPV
jgi:hypothetical protein